jgi:hypothetical protein
VRSAVVSGLVVQRGAPQCSPRCLLGTAVKREGLEALQPPKSGQDVGGTTVAAERVSRKLSVDNAAAHTREVFA